MKILAIDPSFSGCGIACFDNNREEYYYYLIKAEKESKNSIDITRRILKIKEEIRDLIKKHNPDYIGLEGPSYASRSSSVIQMGALNHILRELFIEENMRFIIVPPTVIKKFYAGKGNCNKLEMIEEAMKRGANIPFFKTIQKQRMFDDNVVDAHALATFMNDYFAGKIPEHKSKVEHSF